jgi:hypothetical protein
MAFPGALLNERITVWAGEEDVVPELDGSGPLTLALSFNKKPQVLYLAQNVSNPLALSLP